MLCVEGWREREGNAWGLLKQICDGGGNKNHKATMDPRRLSAVSSHSLEKKKEMGKQWVEAVSPQSRK